MLDRLNPKVRPFYQDDLLVNAIKNDGAARFNCNPFPYPAIVVGRAGSIQREVKLNHVLSDGIPIFRRKGGGCAVFLDPGNLIVSVVFPAKGYLRIQPLFNRANQWLIQGLKNTGMTTLYQDGISDIVINNKKVGGTCFYRARGIAYFSASILVSADRYLMERYLQVPPRAPAYRKGRSHSNFITTLDSHFKGLTIQELVRDLRKNLDLKDLKTHY